MKKWYSNLSTGAALCALLFGTALTAPMHASAAEKITLSEAEKKIPVFIMSQMNSGYREQFISQLLRTIRQSGRDGLFIDKSIIDEKAQEKTKTLQRRNFQRFIGYDLNLDGVVTEEEIRAHYEKSIRGRNRSQGKMTSRQKARLDTLFIKLFVGDSDHDGSITYAEALKYSKEKPAKPRQNRKSKLAQILAFDPNGDGKITVQELEAIGLSAFRVFDKDGNGILDGDERTRLKLVSNKIRRAQSMLQRKKRIRRKTKKQPKRNNELFAQYRHCKLPRPGANADVILINAQKGHAVSSVAVSGINMKTTTGILDIEPGNKPLYILATAYDPLVWQITGATKRISKFIITPGRRNSGVGVTGIDKSKVIILPATSCFGYTRTTDLLKLTDLANFLKKRLKSQSLKTVSTNVISKISIPSGKKSPSSVESHGVVVQVGMKQFQFIDGRMVNLNKRAALSMKKGSKVDSGTMANFNRLYPGGVAKFDMKQVFTSGKAEKYDVLPSHAGLVQLMNQGKLVRSKNGVYAIAKTIPRIPIGLEQERFLLLKGVAVPKEGFKHPCIYSQATRKPLENNSRRCPN